MDAHLLLQAAVGGAELLARVCAAVGSSDQVLDHQANINDGQAVAYWERGLRACTRMYVHEQLESFWAGLPPGRKDSPA